MEIPILQVIIDIFKDTLGEPTSDEQLTSYINFVIQKTTNENEKYTEKHHILPMSVFPKLKNKKEFQSVLIYEDHVEAHLLLAKAYPIRKFVRPLNFMLKDKQHLSDLEKQARVIGWEKFKSTEKYSKFIKGRSERMSKRMCDGLAIEINTKRFKDPNQRLAVSKHFSSLWKDENYRLAGIERAKLCWKDPIQRQKKIDSLNDRWSDPKNREAQSIRMMEVNQSEEKRLDASIKLKAIWQDKERKEKILKNRQRRGAYSVPHFWWNNGVSNSLSPICPDGFVKGQLRKRKST